MPTKIYNHAVLLEVCVLCMERACAQIYAARFSQALAIISRSGFIRCNLGLGSRAQAMLNVQCNHVIVT